MTDMGHIDVPSDTTGEYSGHWYRRGYADALASVQKKINKTEKIFYAVKIETIPDAAGNRRGGWLVYDAAGELAGFADDGGRGYGALHNAAAILAGHGLRGHEHGGQTGAGFDGQGGSIATGLNGTVRITVLCVLPVTPGEYKTARTHGTKKDPSYPDGTARQF